jgi:hypothetical protein
MVVRLLVSGQQLLLDLRPKARTTVMTTRRAVIAVLCSLATFATGLNAGEVQLTGRFPAESKDLPKRLEVSIQSAPERGAKQVLSPATVVCEIRGRTWHCPVPSARLDVKVIPEGFAPQYLWAIDTTDGKKRDVGPVELRRGASVSGWVVLPDGDLPPGGVTVQLRPQLFESVDEPSARSAARIETTKATNRGFFHLRGVPRGVYDLVATSRGWSSARHEGVKVRESREYVLDQPLRFRPLARLDVVIDPPAAADQQPWLVSLDRARPRSMVDEPVGRDVASMDGRWSREGLESGRYQLAVRNAAGATMQTLPIDVVFDGPPVTIRLPLVLVRGRVQAGSDPVAATLDFESSSGGRVSLRADDDGRFSGTLPAEGKYNVRVRQPKGLTYSMRRGVAVRRAEGAAHASVDIDLGPGRIAGRITDDQGRPVKVDVILARNGRPEANASADDDGQFELIGIDSGPVELRASNRSGDTGLVPYQVSDVTNPSVSLVLRRPDRVRCSLLTASGEPVAGALIRYFAPTLPGRREVVSDPAGEFELEVPRGTPLVTIAVLAVGAPIKVAAVSTGSEDVQSIVLAPSGGSILVPMTRETPSPWLQVPGTTSFPMTQLIFPRDGSGFPRGVLPDAMSIEIEPGVYSVCSDPQTKAPRCTTVQVAPGTETRLEPPVAAAANGG